MLRQTGPVGIFGGTFDPIHLGHIEAASEVSRELQFETLHLVPNADPPHRAVAHASAQHRLAMVRLAAEEIPGACVDDRELKREGPSYTVDTLLSLRDEYNDMPLCLILGFDAFAGLQNWDRWRMLLELAHLVVLMRPGHIPTTRTQPSWWSKRMRNHATELVAEPGGFVYFSHCFCREVSASQIRDALAGDDDANAKTAWNQLTPAVAAYIREHNLYQQK